MSQEYADAISHCAAVLSSDVNDTEQTSRHGAKATRGHSALAPHAKYAATVENPFCLTLSRIDAPEGGASHYLEPPVDDPFLLIVFVSVFMRTACSADLVFLFRRNVNIKCLLRSLRREANNSSQTLMMDVLSFFPESASKGEHQNNMFSSFSPSRGKPFFSYRDDGCSFVLRRKRASKGEHQNMFSSSFSPSRGKQFQSLLARRW
jgi:hypothetical protein